MNSKNNGQPSQLNAVSIHLIANLREITQKYQNKMAETMRIIAQLKLHLSADPNNLQIKQQLKKCKNNMLKLRDQIKQDKDYQNDLYRTLKKRIHLDKGIIQERNQEIIINGEQANEIDAGISTLSNIQERNRQKCEQFHDQQFRSKIDFQRVLLHYFVCTNQRKKAEKYLRNIIKQSKIPKPMDLFQPQLSIITRAKKIEGQLKKQKFTQLKKWIYEHSHHLNSIKSQLAFDFTCCQYLMMITSANSDCKQITKAIIQFRKRLNKIQLTQQNKQIITELIMFAMMGNIQQEQEQNKDGIKMRKKKRKIKIDIGGLKNKKLILQPQIINLQDDQQQQQQEFIQYSIPEYLRHLKKYQAQNDQLPLPQISQYQYEEEQQQYSKRLLRQYKQKALKHFIEAFQQIYRIPFQPILTKMITMGITAIKTNTCNTNNNTNHNNNNTNTQQIKQLAIFQNNYILFKKFNNNNKRRCCPVCYNNNSIKLQQIIKRIPLIMYQNTILICRINGSYMNNQENYPMLLPSGQIYSKTGLQTSKKQDKYYCFVKKRLYKMEKCRRVYIV